jgi:hypothetical protein
MEIKAFALIVAAALNPLVSRAPEPQGIVPANCEVSDRLPVTRIAAAETAPDDAAVPLPPVRPAARNANSRTATDLKELQQTLARNDRPAFDAALARARETGAPTRVYEDIARIWDAQFEGPFFSQESEAYRIASGYPGYEAAVRQQVLTDASGRKFYPAGETRAFVAQQVGVITPTTRRASAAPPSGSSSRRVEPSPQRRSSTSMATRRASTSSKAPSKSQTRKTAASRESVPPPRPSPDPSAASTRTAAAAPAPVVPTAVDTSSTEAPPAAGSFEAVDTVPTESTPTPAPSTALADAPATPAAATTTTAPAEGKGRSIVLPAILILIGLGVLILLFRTAK